MKVSVVEALRVQKEIATAVQIAMGMERGCRYGTTVEEGVTLDNGNAKTFPEFVANLRKLFTISQQINSILADFSLKNGISDKVRERENLKVLQRIHESAIQSLPPASTTRFEVVGQMKTKVTRTFTPFVSKAELKTIVKKIKAEIRRIQAEIDVANAQVIDLPFEFDDIEMMNETEG